MRQQRNFLILLLLLNEHKQFVMNTTHKSSTFTRVGKCHIIYGHIKGSVPIVSFFFFFSIITTRKAIFYPQTCKVSTEIISISREMKGKNIGSDNISSLRSCAVGAVLVAFSSELQWMLDNFWSVNKSKELFLKCARLDTWS